VSAWLSGAELLAAGLNHSRHPGACMDSWENLRSETVGLLKLRHLPGRQ